jgi:hypothetical protein
VQTVECINCGEGADALFWVTVGALAVAFLALVMTFFQFRQFLKELRARARFRLTLTPLDVDRDGVLRTAAEVGIVRVQLGIENYGDRAAGETVINVLVPEEAEELSWSGPEGEELEGEDVSFPTSERIRASDGMEYAGKYLAMVLPRIGTNPSHVLYFKFKISLPAEIRFTVPLRVRVEADEIPADRDAYVADLNVLVERTPAS